jgi:hypothetical protein
MAQLAAWSVDSHQLIDGLESGWYRRQLIYTRSKLPWITLPPGVRAFAAYYDSKQLWPVASLERRHASLQLGVAHQPREARRARIPISICSSTTGGENSDCSNLWM